MSSLFLHPLTVGSRFWAVLLLCVLQLSPVAASTVYRWVDAQGRVHYGDATSAPSRAEVVPPQIGSQMPTTPAVDGPTALPATALQSATLSCEQVQSQYDAYLNAAEIFETDALGIQRPIDGAQRERLLARAEMDVSRACDDAAGTP